MTAWGEGTPVVCVHGSLGWGEETWREQRPLAERFRLLVVDRRGFGATPRGDRSDFDRDADDIAALLDEPAHLVGHSYGGVGCLLAAARRPQGVRSLTVIEPPALALVRGHEAVEEFIDRIAHAYRDTRDPADYAARFLASFGFKLRPPRTLAGPELEAATTSMTERPPWEAEIPLDELAAAAFPKLVVRGTWANAPPDAKRIAAAALHVVCDVLEARLPAERVVIEGAAHNPQLVGREFNQRLRAFLEAA